MAGQEDNKTRDGATRLFKMPTERGDGGGQRIKEGEGRNVI